MKRLFRKSVYRGVEKNNKSGWQARICTGPRSNRKRVNLGTYPTPKAAAEAYDDAAFELHGATAVLNFPSRSPRDRSRSSALQRPNRTSLVTNTVSSAPPEQPKSAPVEKPVVMPPPELQAVPAAVRARPIVVPPGCCPNCASPLYGVVGSSDDAKKCRQCGYQTPRAKFDAHGNRMFNSTGEEEAFSVMGISRRQLEDECWMDLHVKGRGVLA
jgi:hypothetical protein